MKTLLLLLVLVILGGCKTVEKQNQIFTDNEWRSILINTLFLAEGNKPYVYKEFDNVRLKDVLLNIYYKNTDLGYEYNDSIIEFINNRKNKPITNKLDTMLNIKFISDTIGLKKNYVIYSEPFYVNKNLICLSMTNKNISKNTTSNWIFFLEKQNDSFNVIEFYDVRKDMYYRPLKKKN